MKRVKNIGFLASIMLIVAFLVAACGSQQKKTASRLDNFELIWADEFDYNGLPDSAKWNYDTVEMPGAGEITNFSIIP
jgi:hypothetical protein